MLILEVSCLPYRQQSSTNSKCNIYFSLPCTSLTPLLRCTFTSVETCVRDNVGFSAVLVSKMHHDCLMHLMVRYLGFFEIRAVLVQILKQFCGPAHYSNVVKPRKIIGLHTKLHFYHGLLPSTRGNKSYWYHFKVQIHSFYQNMKQNIKGNFKISIATMAISLVAKCCLNIILRYSFSHCNS